MSGYEHDELRGGTAPAPGPHRVRVGTAATRPSTHRGVREHAPVDGVHRLPGGPPDRRVAGRVGELAEQVDLLAGPADEVPGRQLAVEAVGAGEHLRQRLTPGPP